jgi:hypothetical protein
VEALPSVVFPVTVRVDTVVVARVEVPVTAKKSVVVAFAVERLVMIVVKALRRDAKRLDDVAFVVDALVAKRLVVVLFVATRLVVDADVA